VESSEFT